MCIQCPERDGTHINIDMSVKEMHVYVHCRSSLVSQWCVYAGGAHQLAVYMVCTCPRALCMRTCWYGNLLQADGCLRMERRRALPCSGFERPWESGTSPVERKRPTWIPQSRAIWSAAETLQGVRGSLPSGVRSNLCELFRKSPERVTPISMSPCSRLEDATPQDWTGVIMEVTRGDAVSLILPSSVPHRLQTCALRDTLAVPPYSGHTPDAKLQVELEVR